MKNPNARGYKVICSHLLKAYFGEDNKKWFRIDGKPTCIAFRDRKDRPRRRQKTDKNQLNLW
jgi:hypothetical protein